MFAIAATVFPTTAASSRACSPAHAQADSGEVRRAEEIAARMVTRLQAQDDESAEAAFLEFERLWRTEPANPAEWSAETWCLYAEAVAHFAVDTTWVHAFPEPPFEMLERLASTSSCDGDPEALLDLQMAAAILLRDRLAFAEARRRMEQLLERPTTPREHRSRLWTELGYDCLALGDYDAALEALECGLIENDALHAGPRRDFHQDLNAFELELLRTRIEIEIGRPDRAARALERARRVEPFIADPYSREQLLSNEVDLAFATDDKEAAIARLESGRAEGWLPPHLLERLGFAYLYSGDGVDVADDRAREIFELTRAHPEANSETLCSVSLGLAAIERRAGRLEEAGRWLDEARTSRDAALRTELAVESAALAVASGERGDELEDEWRALIECYDEALARWSSIPAQPDGIGYTNYVQRRALLSELIRLELARDPQRGVERALEHVVRAEALGSLARALSDDPPNHRTAIASLCSERSGVLIYLPGPERGFVIAADSERADAAELGPTRVWRVHQSALMTLLSLPPAKERYPERRLANYRRRVHELSQALLPEAVQRRLEGWDSVTIVGLDMLGYVPFECLEANGEELGLAKAVAYLPSLVLAELLEHRSRTTGASGFGLRLFAAPAEPLDAAARYGWSKVEWSERRARRLEDIWDGALRISRQEGATLAALRSDAGSELAVLEILSHGFYDPTRSPPVGIAMTPDTLHDGYVYASDLVGLRVPPIVALAVCGAARGPLRSGDDGAGHLGGAFLRAGANVVLLASLDIEQSTTEALLDETYRGMTRDGASVAEALRRARVKLAASPHASDPYYRNLLHAVGLGRTRAPARASASPPGEFGPRRVWIGLSVLALACGAAWLRWRRRAAALS